MALVKNENNARAFVEQFRKWNYPDNFISALGGNWCVESAHSFEPNQVQLSYLNNKNLGIKSCDDYVARVDNGTWKDNQGRDFTTDRIGFGLAQWTSLGRKKGFYDYCKSKNYSVGSLIAQIEFTNIEIYSVGYANVRKAIKENWSIEECARIICTEYERPSKKDDATVQQKRIDYALQFYDAYVKEKPIVTPIVESKWKIKICLDSGHYGKYNRSPVVREYYESDFNWKFTNYEKEELERLGFEVILTRKNKDVDLSLNERGKASKGCTVFISNHSNACSTESVNHPSIIIPVAYGSTDVDANKRLATLIGNNIASVLGTSKPKIYSKVETYDRNKNGKVGDDEYYGVLNGSQSVGTPYRMIVEHSFHTNKAVATKLLDDNIVKKLAISESRMIAQFFGTSTDTVETTNVYHTVVKGDSLSKIAKSYGITLATIKTLNPDIKAPLYIIKVGQKIRVK